jgi:hypothetical protein
MSSTSSSSSSSSSYFNPAPRFEAWIEENAETKGWVAEIKDMYEASGSSQPAFVQAVFKQVGYSFDKLNSDGYRAILRDLAPKVVDMTDVIAEDGTGESVISIEDFPAEVLCNIFSNLDFKTLGTCYQVNQQWKRLTTDPLVLKQAAYNNSFSNAEWVRCFGDQSIGR